MAKTDIRNRVLRSGPVDWRTIKPFQPDILKKQTVEQHEKLKRSLRKNGVASPFFVFELKGVTYALDGHHRLPALRELELEGVNLPDKLQAIWLDAKNEKDAKKLLLIFNSHYAKIQKDGLGDFIGDLNLDDIAFEIDIPELKIDELNPIEPDYDEVDERIADENPLAGRFSVEEREAFEVEIARRVRLSKAPNEVEKRHEAITVCIETLRNETTKNIAGKYKAKAQTDKG